MNVWTTLPRSLASSKCLHNMRFLMGESSSSSIHHFSTNTPASTKQGHVSELLKEALTQADSQLHAQHSPPRLESPSDSLTLNVFKTFVKRSKKKKKKKKKVEGMLQTVSKLQSIHKEPLSSPSDPPPTFTDKGPSPSDSDAPDSAFASETWPTEPWATTGNHYTCILSQIS